VNKKKVLERLLPKSSLSSRGDYFKQYSIFNSLLKTYDNENFWSVVNFGNSLTSLYFLKTPFGGDILLKKYKEFCYKPRGKDRKYSLGEKTGEDIITPIIKKTTRNFLNE
jgi:hypothetical protein